MPDDPEVEFTRLSAVLRGLGWTISVREVTNSELVVTARRPWQPSAPPASPR